MVFEDWFAKRSRLEKKVPNPIYQRTHPKETSTSTPATLLSSDLNLKRLEVTDIVDTDILWSDVIQKYPKSEIIYLCDDELCEFPSELADFPMVDVRHTSIFMFPKVRGLRLDENQLKFLFIDIEKYTHLEKDFY